MRLPTRTPKRTPVLALIGCALLAAGLVLTTGCTRRFYRNWADREVLQVLDSKDNFPEWELHDYYVYPNPLARFADPTDPDHPPMPPDDVGAWLLSTHPQRPKHVAYLEGTGYLQVLETWDAQNRARLKEREKEQPERLPAPIYTQSTPAVHPGEDRGKAAATQGPRRPVNVTITWNAKPSSEPGPTAPPQVDPMGALVQAQALQDASNEEESKLGPDGCRREPYLINLDQAVELAVFNSREFQDRREGLYLAALPVTFERFNFLPQFFATERVFREWAGNLSNNGKENKWEANPGTAGFSQLFPTGALLTLQLANRTVINLTGSPKHTISESTLLLDLSQPLLQAGGRAVTLEPLTQAERDLVYELRLFARFHREFYVDITVGGPFAYYPTILQLAVLENNQQNVESFAGLLRFYRFLVIGGFQSPLTAQQIEQRLLNARNAVLLSELRLQDSLDQFKLQLGLPTNLPLTLDFGPLQPLKDQMRRLERVEFDFRAIMDRLQNLEDQPEIPPAELRVMLRRMLIESELVRGTKFQREAERRLAVWQELAAKMDLHARLILDLAGMPLQIPFNPAGLPLPFAIGPPQSLAEGKLQELLQELERLEDEQERYTDEEKEFPKEKRDRMRVLRLEIDLGGLAFAMRLYDTKVWEQAADRRAAYIRVLREVSQAFALVVESARAERSDALEGLWPDLPAVSLQGMDLLTTDEKAAQHLVEETALNNRLDLMNARAQVVDAWRQIAVFANSLLGVADLQYHMEVMTPRNEAQPLTFWGRTGIHRLNIATELPLVRQLERNNYRASLIAYQQLRRALMLQEDTVRLQVRSELRQLRQLKQSYRINQQAVKLAYQQAESAKEELLAPAGPGAQTGAAAAAAALTQQVVTAQNSVLGAQNDIYGSYVSYIQARMELYRDLELLRVDSRGVWIDEYASPANGTHSSHEPEPGER